MSIHIAEYQSEKLIIACRLILASFLYWTGEIGSVSGSWENNLSAIISLAYLTYSAVLLFLAWFPSIYFPHMRLITHSIDLAVFSLLIFLADSPDRLAAILFSFLITSAAVRRSWFGVTVTSATVIFSYAAFVVYRYVNGEQTAEDLLNPGLVMVYLIVLALLLTYMAQYEWRTRNELVKLATWPRELTSEQVPSMLTRAVAELFDAPRALMIWDEYEEPWRFIAYFNNGRTEQTRESPSAFEPLVAQGLANAHFIKSSAKNDRRTMTLDESDRLRFWRGAALNTELQRYYRIDSVLVLKLNSTAMSGWLFVLDVDQLSSDDLIAGKVVARQLETDMERWHVQRQTRLSIVTEERIRLARDLHDGLLQSLTGLALKIKAVEDQLDFNPESVREALQEVRASIQHEQRDLRTVVKSMRLSEPEVENEGLSLTKRLEELAEVIQRDWSISVELNLFENINDLSELVGHQVYRLIQEAVHNAAQHSGGSLVTVNVALYDQRIALVICDDGRGFPFLGRYAMEDLKSQKYRPGSLIKRVSNLHGSMLIDSTIEGSCVEIKFQLAD